MHGAPALVLESMPSPMPANVSPVGALGADAE
jgi:hypothetical protein